ncbi:hypothetical protein Ddye_020050 [Dipteronia dyeriana]|uniref:AC transposase n=1 Tax=Dipteronia dyeriana TaxID=168575 RepID=A0AAD9TZ16_9ROSI|nr:hypothetical protein Ddye_020050 [Dipteronia dyeriana]
MDCNIDRKLSSITVDNCSTNKQMITSRLEKLNSSDLILNGTLFHMRCCAHILNLIVNDGLDVIGKVIERIRSSVLYWVATPKRIEKFEDTAHQLNIPYSKRLVLDCPTRWNSTYFMLTTTLLYKDFFACLSVREKQYKIEILGKDWKLAAILQDNLKLFYQVTEMFSGTKYQTTNLFFLHICDIRLSLFEWLTNENEVIKEMAVKMIEKFEKYWDVIHGVMVVATMLDPRYKMRLIEFYFPSIFRADYITHLKSIQKLCLDLVKEYELKFKPSDENSIHCNSSLASQLETPDDSSKQAERLLSYDLFVSSDGPTHVKSEYDAYLEENVLPRINDFDILVWWRENASKYPILAQIARDFLDIPCIIGCFRIRIVHVVE